MTSNRFTIQSLNNFCRHLAKEYGLSFPPAKFDLVENRVEPLLEKFSCSTLNDLMVKSKSDTVIRREILNNLTTNETWFFRHPAHFRILSDHIFPAIIASKKKQNDNKIRIWSAGCSIGAELYSILITLLNSTKAIRDFNILLTGSDISADAVARARNAVYSLQETRLIDYATLNTFFSDEGSGWFKLRHEYQQYAEFEVSNLLERWPSRTFDIIFCRNTMIYFSSENKKKLTERFYKALNLGGYYLTSANETMHWEDKKDGGFDQLFLDNDIVYQKSAGTTCCARFKFTNSTDLLRAVNVLKESGIDFTLEKTAAKSLTAPKRAIRLDCEESDKAMDLFELSSIKNYHREKSAK